MLALIMLFFVRKRIILFSNFSWTPWLPEKVGIVVVETGFADGTVAVAGIVAAAVVVVEIGFGFDFVGYSWAGQVQG